MNIHLYDNRKDISVGMAQLFYNPVKRGWVAPGGIIITDLNEALRYACQLDELIKLQTQKKKRKAPRF